LKWEPHNDNVFIASEENQLFDKKFKEIINTEHLNKGVTLDPNKLTRIKDANITRDSLSTCNFPLVVAKKEKEPNENKKMRVGIRRFA